MEKEQRMGDWNKYAAEDRVHFMADLVGRGVA